MSPEKAPYPPFFYLELIGPSPLFLPYIPQAIHARLRNFEPVHVIAFRPLAGRVEQNELRCLIHHDTLQIIVQLGALEKIFFYDGFLCNLCHFGK